VAACCSAVIAWNVNPDLFGAFIFAPAVLATVTLAAVGVVILQIGRFLARRARVAPENSPGRGAPKGLVLVSRVCWLLGGLAVAAGLAAQWAARWTAHPISVWAMGAFVAGALYWLAAVALPKRRKWGGYLLMSFAGAVALWCQGVFVWNVFQRPPSTSIAGLLGGFLILFLPHALILFVTGLNWKHLESPLGAAERGG